MQGLNGGAWLAEVTLSYGAAISTAPKNGPFLWAAFVTAPPQSWRRLGATDIRQLCSRRKQDKISLTDTTGQSAEMQVNAYTAYIT